MIFFLKGCNGPDVIANLANSIHVVTTWKQTKVKTLKIGNITSTFLYLNIQNIRYPKIRTYDVTQWKT